MDAGRGMLEIAIVTIELAFVSGLFALLGGFLGAFLTRRTDYEKWLRQQRSQVFADFIVQVQSFQKKAIDIIHSQLPLLQRDIEITELFLDVETHMQIARLYLDLRDRSQFEELTTELRVSMNPHRDQGERSGKFNQALKEIQLIFEAALDSCYTKFWNRVFV